MLVSYTCMCVHPAITNQHKKLRANSTRSRNRTSVAAKDGAGESKQHARENSLARQHDDRRSEMAEAGREIKPQWAAVRARGAIRAYTNRAVTGSSILMYRQTGLKTIVLHPPSWLKAKSHSFCTQSSCTLAQLHAAMSTAFAQPLAAHGVDATEVTLEYRKANPAKVLDMHSKVVLFRDSQVAEAIDDALQEGSSDTVRLHMLVPLVSVPANRRSCAECGAVLSSRNMLFAHLRETGHGGVGPEAHVPSHTRQESVNEAFNVYYMMQRLCNSAEEWAAVYAHCKTPLPQAIRINHSSSLARAALGTLLEDSRICKLTSCTYNPESSWIVNWCTAEGKQWLAALQEAGDCSIRVYSVMQLLPQV